MPVDVEEELARFGAGLQAVQQSITVADLPAAQRSMGRRSDTRPVDVELVDPADADPAQNGTGGPSRRQRWSLVAAAVVVVAFGGLAALTRHRDGPPAAPAASAPGPTSVGNLDEVVPDFSGQLMDGGDISLSELRGQWVVLGFVQSACVPCGAQQESYAQLDVELAVAYGNVRLLTIGYDDSESSLRAFMARHGTTAMIIDDGTIVPELGVTQVPETWIIDPDGVLRSRNVGGVDYRTLRSTLSALVATRAEQDVSIGTTPPPTTTGFFDLRTGIDLDVFAGEPAVDPGPFTVFDLDDLPPGWTVEFAGGGHRITDPTAGNYRWMAQVTKPDGGVVWLLTGRGESSHLDTDYGRPLDVDGRPTRLREGGIVWTEPDGVIAMISLGQDVATESELLALQQELGLTTIPTLEWSELEPAPESTPSPVRSEPALAGTVAGTPWTLYSEPSAHEWLEMRVGPEPAAMNSGGGSPDTDVRPGAASATWTVNYLGLGSTGSMLWGTAPEQVDHLNVDVNGETVVLNVAHDRNGLTLFAVPLPPGLDITAIRFVDSEGNDLHRALPPPPFRSPALDGLALTLPFGDTVGQQLTTS